MHLRAEAPNRRWYQHTVEDETSRGASGGRSSGERGGVEERLCIWNLDDGRRCAGTKSSRRLTRASKRFSMLASAGSAAVAGGGVVTALRLCARE